MRPGFNPCIRKIPRRREWQPVLPFWLELQYWKGIPLQCSCLENPMDRGAWWPTVHGVARGRTQLSKSHFHHIPFAAQGTGAEIDGKYRLTELRVWASQVTQWWRFHLPIAGDTGCGFNPWVGTIPWRRKWQPSPVFLHGKAQGQSSCWATVHRVAKSWTQLSIQAT